MGINIGGINSFDTIINTGFCLIVLENIVDRLLQASIFGMLSGKDIKEFRKEVINILNKKHHTPTSLNMFLC